MGIYDYYPLQWEMLKNSYLTSGKDAATAASLATSKIGSTLKYNPFVGVADDAIVGTDGKLNSSADALKWGMIWIGKMQLSRPVIVRNII